MIRLLASVTVAFVLSLLGPIVMPAYADGQVEHRNPRNPNNPFAVAFTAGAKSTGEKPEVCVAVYKAPPAFGEEPTTPATGGSPGWVLHNRAGTPWTCNPHDPL